MNIPAWITELENDIDREYLLSGILNGFDIIKPDAQLSTVYVQNHKSALDCRDEMDKVIVNEIKEGNYIITKDKPIIVSALGAVRKIFYINI